MCRRHGCRLVDLFNFETAPHALWVCSGNPADVIYTSMMQAVYGTITRVESTMFCILELLRLNMADM